MSNDTPENLILHLLRNMDKKIDDLRAEVKSDMQTLRADIKSDMHTLRADVAADLLEAAKSNAVEHKNTREQIVGLRRAVMEYHSSAIGHGVLISELEERIRRVEDHLKLPTSISTN